MTDRLTHRIQAAAGEIKASLVLKNANYVNVFTEEIETGDIAIEDGMIVGTGRYEGVAERDFTGLTVCPGLIDGHIHLESSMVLPSEFERAVLPHGTTAVVTDPHEIANVAGQEGILYMLDAARDLLMDVYFMLPSCVPSTNLDEAGAVLNAAELEPFYDKARVLGLAELMDFYGTAAAKPSIVAKIKGAAYRAKVIDGHAPGLTGKPLNAYITAGVLSDHECSGLEEALEKLRKGQWVMIREGTAAKNLEALLPLFLAPRHSRCMLVTDDKHPGDLRRLGHMDFILRKAVELGVDPIKAVIMGTYNPARYFGLKKQGAVAPGYMADLVAFSDLKNFKAVQVYKDGILAAEDGHICLKECGSVRPGGNWMSKKRPERVFNSFHMEEVKAEQLHILPELRAGSMIRVIDLMPHELTTRERLVPCRQVNGCSLGVDTDQDVVKMAVFERHMGTGHIGIGFLGNYGLKKGAVASSVAHDSHNLIVAGTNDSDMILAANTVRKNRGGLVIVSEGKILGELALSVAGLMSEDVLEAVDERLEGLKKMARQLGVPETVDPFMTLAFVSLPVIPKLRLNTYGIIDVMHQKVVDLSVYVP